MTSVMKSATEIVPGDVWREKIRVEHVHSRTGRVGYLYETRPVRALKVEPGSVVSTLRITVEDTGTGAHTVVELFRENRRMVEEPATAA